MSNRELPSNPEGRTKDRWILMRPDDEASSLSFGSVRWDTPAVLYGKKLQLNVDRFGRHISNLGIKTQIHIVGANRELEDGYNLTGQASEEGAISGSMSVTSAPLIKGDILYAPSSSTTYIGVNYLAESQLAERSLPQGRDNPSFYKTYAKGVNRQLRGQLYEVLKRQNQLDPQQHSKLVGEVNSMLYMVFAPILFTTIGILNMNVVEQHIQEWTTYMFTAMATLKMMGTFTDFLLAVQSREANKPLSPYHEYLLQNLSNIVYPKILADQVIKPKISNAVPKALIKSE